MALSPSFLDELRARTPLAAVIGRRVKLARSGRQMKGCCPFHQEKTPSFYVYEDGYHCFGCGAHGDAISFVMQTQGAAFMEAVEQLAAEAGLGVPKPTPEAAEAERKRHDLASVLEAAQTSYQRRLHLPEGRHALDYLRTRGLTDETIHRFGLGWSGDGRGTLAAELLRDGITQDLLVEAGLMRADDATNRPFDLFFNRVMFPIRDRRGRVISFGGRTLGDAQPKYVNGPETALFSKRRTLYALDLAREAVRGGAPLVVVEGYMDVIALAQAGFGAAIAPLGTALTEEQLDELWRLSPAPILCFDGDAAGARAAARAAELALPMLAPERTLRIAALPEGEDPDSLVRSEGYTAFRSRLDSAPPLSDTLFDMTRDAVGDASVEQRAALRKRLVASATKIGDRSLSYEMRDRLLAIFRDRYRRRFEPQKQIARVPRIRFAASDANAEYARNSVAILLRHPDLIPSVTDAFEQLELPDWLDRLRRAMVHWTRHASELVSEMLVAELDAIGLRAEVRRALASIPMPLSPCAAASAQPSEVEAGWYHHYGLMRRAILDQDVDDALNRYRHDQTEDNHRILKNLSVVRERLNRAQFEEDVEA